MGRGRSAVSELLEFVESIGDRPLELEEEDRLFELDIRAGIECDAAGITIPNLGLPHAREGTPRTQLAFSRESIYERPGNLYLAADLPAVESHLRITLEPTNLWLQAMRVIAEQTKPTSRQAAVAGEDDPLSGIPESQLQRCRSLKGVAEYAHKHFGHRPSERSIREWKKRPLRMAKRGALWVFCIDDLRTLVEGWKKAK